MRACDLGVGVTVSSIDRSGPRGVRGDIIGVVASDGAGLSERSCGPHAGGMRQPAVMPSLPGAMT